jgi:hypothetical protein
MQISTLMKNMQECKVRTPKMFKYFTLKSHQSNKWKGEIREEEQRRKSTNDSKIQIQWVPLT